MRSFKKYTLLMFVLCVTALSIQSTVFASAAGPWADDDVTVYEYVATDFLQVTFGNYLDLDGDGLEDDIINEFTIFTPTGAIAYDVSIDYKFYLTLPSGKTFWLNYRMLVDIDHELPVDVYWFNVVEESGDYKFTCDARIVGTDVNGVRFNVRVIQSIIFDPPKVVDGDHPGALIIF